MVNISTKNDHNFIIWIIFRTTKVKVQEIIDVILILFSSILTVMFGQLLQLRKMKMTPHLFLKQMHANFIAHPNMFINTYSKYLNLLFPEHRKKHYCLISWIRVLR